MKTRAEEIVKDKMLANDAFSQWLGIEVLELKEGYCKLSMRMRDEMTNGFKIAHGGISYSLADSALAFASNSYGRQALSIETSISHLKSVKISDELIAEAKEISRSNKLGIYHVTISSNNNLIADFKGTVYLSSREWE